MRGALVLAPTRELADQIADELRSFAGDLRVEAVYGGVGYGKQLDALKKGVDILVALPRPPRGPVRPMTS